MPSAEEVREWIEWGRANPFPQGQYPVIREVGELDVPYAEAARNHFHKGEAERERTLDVFAAELARDPTDVDARFVTLHFYHLARATAEMEDSEGISEPDFWPPKEFGKGVARIRANFRRELAPLIGLLRVEECPATWKFIEWEILNACLVGDLERILKLLTRAEDEKLLDRTLAHVFRGQYRFVAALEGTEELESQGWRPRLYRFPDEDNERDQLTGLTLLSLGIATVGSRAVTDRSQMEFLVEAAHDLAKAVAAIPVVPPAYRAALARGYFGIGKFRDAAYEYEHLLSANLKFGDILDLRKPVYESLVLSHERAGDGAAAKDALIPEIQEYPKEKRLWLRMAKLESQEARHDEVAACVRKELEIAPEADADWRLSTILALAETQRSLEELKRAFPQLCEGVEWGLGRFWPAFRKLHPEAAKACTEAEVDAALSKHAEFFPEKFSRDAASKWAVAVEVELREALFCDFRAAVGRVDSLRAAAEEGGGRGSKTEVFSRFLLGKGRLALGQMHRVLCECNSAAPGDGMFYELQAWLRREHPQFHIAEAARVLQRVSDFRNPAMHREGSAGDPEEAVGLCRSFLEAFTSTY